MAYVNIQKDLSTIKTKVAFGLTKRQLVYFSLAAVIGIPFYLLTRKFLGNDISVIFMIILMLPFFLLAMYEKDGQTPEKLLKNYMQFKNSPHIRLYKTKNIYNYLQTDNKQGGTASAEKQKKSTKTNKRNSKQKNRIKKRQTGIKEFENKYNKRKKEIK